MLTSSTSWRFLSQLQKDLIHLVNLPDCLILQPSYSGKSASLSVRFSGLCCRKAAEWPAHSWALDQQATAAEQDKRADGYWFNILASSNILALQQPQGSFVVGIDLVCWSCASPSQRLGMFLRTVLRWAWLRIKNRMTGFSSCFPSELLSGKEHIWSRDFFLLIFR